MHKHGATVSQFVGNRIMALFNVPLDQPDHAQRAVSAGLEMLSVLDKGAPSGPTFGIGINIASRLSNLAQGGQVLIGAQTYQAVNEMYHADPQGTTLLKGMSRPVMIYRLKA
ncbi:MAG: adenylate/guanylate cyclase domain-containing protein [Anaerolineales bacterium]|nr:adenylate/guanylate cyclase domain-containing protein [Anaerolineales bacterium]